MKKLFIIFVLCCFLSACTQVETTQNTTTTQKKETLTSISEDGGVGYQIFVSTFANGNPNVTISDGHATGDIKGITNNLDYLKDTLNVDVLWLTPIHDSPSYHCYDVTDFNSINEGFGGFNAYQELLEEAHKRNIYVMLDLVINHTSTANEWFMNSTKKDSTYRDYYRWSDTAISSNYYLASGSYYYALFWDQMPDLNYDNHEVYNEMVDVCKFYLDLGVDGFRVDGAKHVYNYGDWGSKELPDKTNEENYQSNLNFFKNLSTDLKAYDEDCFLTLEVLDYDSNIIADYVSQGVDSCFDFSMRNTIVDGINNNKGETIASTYSTQLAKLDRLNETNKNSLILSNHDITRVLTDLGDSTEKAKLAAAIQMTLPGLSWIYNGDELGMSGYKSGSSYEDLGLRQPYKWGNAYETSTISLGSNSNAYDSYNQNLDSAVDQLNDESSMLMTYSKLTALKANDPVIKHGDFEVANLDASLCSYTRTYNGVTYLVVNNTSSKKINFTYDLADSQIIYNNGASITETGGEINAYGTVVIRTAAIEVADVDKVVIHYDIDNDYKIWEWSTCTGRWVDFTSTDSDGNKTATIDVKNLNLTHFKFLIGKETESDWLIDGGNRSYIIIDSGNKTFDIYIKGNDTSDKNINIDVNPDWDIKEDSKYFVWTWSTGISGSWIEANYIDSKLTFTVPYNIENCVIVEFPSSTVKPDWANKTKQTVDLKINGDSIASVTWK